MDFIKADKAENHELAKDISDNVKDFYNILMYWNNRATRARKMKEGIIDPPLGYKKDKEKAPEKLIVPPFALYPGDGPRDDGQNCHRESIVWYFVLLMKECHEQKCRYGPNCRKGIHLPEVNFVDMANRVSSEEMILENALEDVSRIVRREGVGNLDVVAGILSEKEAHEKNEKAHKSSLHSFEVAVRIKNRNYF